MEFLEKVEQKWKVAATSLHNDVLFDTEECHEREANCVEADIDALVRSFEGITGGQVAAEISRRLGRYRSPQWRSPADSVGDFDGNE